MAKYYLKYSLSLLNIIIFIVAVIRFFNNPGGTLLSFSNKDIFIAILLFEILLFAVIYIIKYVRSHAHNELTMEGKATENSFNKYPRPQLKRDSYLNLNGYYGDALVPFPIGSVNSGVKKLKHNTSEYKRFFTIPKGFINNRVLLHFGAVDTISEVFIDGKAVGYHEGGYTPFTLDITDYVKEENSHELLIKIFDNLSEEFPYGKQVKKRGGMWYTPIAGIWQTVWIESVPEKYIEHIEYTPTLNSVTVNIDSECAENDVKVLFKGDVVFTYNYDSPYFTIEFSNPKLWTPDEPNIYEIEIKTESDFVKSYFALRTVSIGKIDNKPRILLNNKPVFFNGLLDQGYYPEGLFLPNDDSFYEKEILNLKNLGFNTIRKHIKIEPEIFYEACDRLGMFVFQDFVNNGHYSFIRDTALPTMGYQKLDDTKKHVPDAVKARFIETMVETIDLLYSHPSIIYYTIFNEGWGQFDSDDVYDIATSLDKTRIFDSTSGWFRQNKSMVESFHIYFDEIKFKESDRPIILSEFGGISYKDKAHSFSKYANYGYKTAVSPEDFTKMYRDMYEESIVPNIENGLCGVIYTQVSDVEDETNGIYTYDRKVCKLKASEIKETFDKLKINI